MGRRVYYGLEKRQESEDIKRDQLPPGLVHWEDPEGLGREGGGRGDRDGEYM